jgi:hypothetical protein
MTLFGRSIDELKVNRFNEHSLTKGEEGLSDGDRSLSGTNHTSLDHEPVIGYVAVVGEATKGVDALFGKISISHARSVISHLTKLVDSLVHLSSVVVTVLTSSSNSEVHSGRVPSSNTSNLSETSVSLSGKSRYTPSSNHALSAVTLGSTATVEDFAFREDLTNSDLRLEQVIHIVDLLGNGTSVDLDLHDMSLLLSEVRESRHHRVADSSDHRAVLLHSLQLSGDLLGSLLVLLGVLSEGLSLGSAPVLVESSSAIRVKVLGPHGGEGSKASGSFHVTHQTHTLHGRGLHDGNSLYSLLLVELGARTVDFSHNVSHASLEGHERGEVGLLGSIISREGSHSASVVSSSLSREESQTAVSGSFKLSVRHC